MDKTREMQTEAACVEHPVCPSQTHLRVAATVRATVTERERILRILASLVAARAMGTIRVVDERSTSDELDAPGVVELAPGPRLLISAGFRDSAEDGVWRVELQGAFSLVRFELLRVDRWARGYFAVPAALECVYRRSERRASAPPSARIRFTRRLAPNQWYDRPLRDVGFGGAQFVTEPDDCFETGEELCEVEVTWKHGSRIPLLAVVRHVSAVEHSEGGLCGVSIRGRGDAARGAWQVEISSLLHPETTTTPSRPPEELWNLYEESGYFELGGRTAGEFLHLKDDFLRASAKLSQASTVSCCVVRECRGRIEAAMSMLRCWTHAWLAYQGARRQSENPMALSGNAVLRDMYLHAYEFVQQDPKLQWNIAYIRKDARFTRRANYEFAAARNDGTSIAIVPFRALQVACDDPCALRVASGANISFATPKEICRIVDALARRFPRPYLEAYDFELERFDLCALKAEWARTGLLRDRAVLVLRNGKQAIAAAIMDIVESGVHLVGLADSVRLVELTLEAYLWLPELLDAVRQFYLRRGRHQFVLFDESSRPDLMSSVGATDLGEADQVFVSATLTPEFLDNICHITASTGQAVLR